MNVRLGAALLILLPNLSGAAITLRRPSIDNGGGHAESARFELDATIGQHDAGPPLQGTRFELQGGWHRAQAPGPIGDAVFANSFE